MSHIDPKAANLAPITMRHPTSAFSIFSNNPTLDYFFSEPDLEIGTYYHLAHPLVIRKSRTRAARAYRQVLRLLRKNILVFIHLTLLFFSGWLFFVAHSNLCQEPVWFAFITGLALIPGILAVIGRRQSNHKLHLWETRHIDRDRVEKLYCYQ